MLMLLLVAMHAEAQRFFNLTSSEVTVDSVLPHFSYAVPLTGNYADSTYTCSLLYPEFIDMTLTDVLNYRRLSSDSLPALPVVHQSIAVDRKQGELDVQFCPLVYREGKYQILVSFMLRVDAQAKSRSVRRVNAKTRATGTSSRYASHSVLASGRWAKVRVSETGIYQLTEQLIRQAGFTDLSHVKIYGYGGNLQPETLTGDYLSTHDDLQEVPTCTVNGRRLFLARGPVSWNSTGDPIRTRNPYSDYGYYFITEGSDEPATIDSTALMNSLSMMPEFYNDLHEVDGYSWYQGGRNLFDTQAIAQGQTRTYLVPHHAGESPDLYVRVSAGNNSTASIAMNSTTLGSIKVTLSSYDKGNMSGSLFNYNTDNIGNKSGTEAYDTLKITTTAGGPIRLDFYDLCWNKSWNKPSGLSGSFPAPEYVYNITNQDHHADSQADMVIIIPTSQKLLAQAQRLATFHESHDGMRVNIVPADELYNEFSSGTPDANAYRRYLKMLYDRAETSSDMPKYLLLMGDCVWDNRLRTPDCSNLNADDLLLCFESENSFNEVTCYVDDGFFCLLDDGEGGNPLSSDKLDVAVGRFPVTTEDQAKVMVDKVISYVNNDNAGAWQNTIMFMGDDGNSNIHMRDINEAAEDIMARYPNYYVKKVMWDAYSEVSTSTGNTYPQVTAIIKEQQQAGALIMDYGGHGRADQIAHERVLSLNDFQNFTNQNLPLWITASCDIMPFDGSQETIGETAVLNQNGGAVAFFGTTRTVYSNYNRVINMAYLRLVLSHDSNGKALTIGEAQRQAKNQMIDNRQDLTCNKLQYSLLGDPALPLNLPSMSVVIDSINGVSATDSNRPQLKAGGRARIVGHVENGENFNGVVTATVRDTRELVTCNNNVSAEADEPFTFYNRSKVLFQGSDSIRSGQFSFNFNVPLDINYADDNGMLNIYAVNSAHDAIASGSNDDFIVGGTEIVDNDSLGPKIYCYLNSTSFVDGGTVNTTPYFVANISDDDGINVSGTGIGHNLHLCVDNDPAMTYDLNDNFQYDFGTSTSGRTWYSLPELEPGRHTLTFRAWDVLNNSSSATLHFNVVRGLSPTIYSVDLSDNPAKTSTTFIISHNFMGSDLDVTIRVFDTSGRLLWKHHENGTAASGAYTVDWNLTEDSGARLQTGIYLYSVSIASNGSEQTTKAKKFVVISNN